ncbi:MAG: ABC transporter ATP-binding protein [Dictyoglomaceae bacterium]|nr:ABC transporter ATP-binding protein [Dictyoglomaceae bacterium]
MVKNEFLLEVKNLSTYFFTDEGIVKAVDGVSFKLSVGESLGILGESGCGKSVTALSIMRLVQPPGRIISGEVLFDGEDLLIKPEEEMRQIRGNKISMIFQDPMTSLNPVFTVGDQIIEAITLHQGLDKKNAKKKAIEMLELVRIPEADKRINDYPHQFSGGMRQRVMIAMALSCNPSILIADEPTTALDVTIQAQILELIKQLRKEFQMSTILITHDMGIVAEYCDNILVMYAGKVVEYADLKTIFKHPAHPYTIGLLESVPRLDVRRERLNAIEGQPPDLIVLPNYCYYAERCPFRTKECLEQIPELIEIEKGHLVRCIHAEEVRR